MTDRTLLVDIGNTRVKWAFADPSSGAIGEVQASPHDVLPDPLVSTAPARIVYANVASSDLVTRAFAAWPEPDVVELRATREACGVLNGYRHPERLGADRWAALIGAHALAPDRDLLVCGLGTATTIDLLVRADGDRARFVGGMILPGAQTMRRALARDTARLPLTQGTATDFATDTDDAIASGIRAAQLGAIERAVLRARSLHDVMDLTVLFAGGDASTLASAMQAEPPILVVPDLVLRGLAVVARAHRPQYDAG